MSATFSIPNERQFILDKRAFEDWSGQRRPSVMESWLDECIGLLPTIEEL
jgi:hypothetical protein